MDRLPTAAWAALPIAASAFVHQPILDQYFKGDDFLHLFQIVNHGGLEFIATPHGGHTLLAPNLAFYLCHLAFGIESAGYQWVLLLTHLLNVGLLYGLILNLTRRPGLAVFGAALFGLSPTAQGSIHWFSVYGNVLAASGTVWVLFDATRPSRRSARVPPHVQAIWYATLLAVGTSFGVGLAVAMPFGAVLYALRPNAPDQLRVARRFASLALVLPLIYGLHQSLFAAEAGVPNAADQLSRLGTIASLLAQLTSYGWTTLLAGPLVARLDGGITWGPLLGVTAETAVHLSYAVSASTAAAGFFLWRRADRSERLALIAFATIAVSGYAIVAVGRAFLVEASFRHSSEWFVSVTRYHYVGPLAMSAALCVALGRVAADAGQAERIVTLLPALLVLAAIPAYAAASATLHPPLATEARSEHKKALQRIERAVRRQPGRGTVFISNRDFSPVRYAMLRAEEFPGLAAVYVISYPTNRLKGREVRFVEKNPAVLAAARARTGTRIAELLVAPGARR